MSSSELDYAVAKALGWEIVPANKADSGTFEVGKTYLFTDGEQLGRECVRARDYVNGNGKEMVDVVLGWWSPSTSAEDAITALEKLFELRKLEISPSMILVPGGWCVKINVLHRSDPIISMMPTLPEAICKCIIAAQEPSRG